MDKDIIAILTEARETGEILKVKYFGGSQPGSIRQLSPIKISQTEIRAREIETGAVKTFLLDKMELVDSLTIQTNYVPNKKEVEPLTIREGLSSKIETLTTLGWHVNLDENSISLHKYFKNGKVRKGADVGITKYTENPSRPFYVYSTNFVSARTFGKILSAISLFNEEAKLNAPNKN